MPARGRACGVGWRLLCAVLWAVLAPGCTTMRPVPPAPRGFQEVIRPGDELRVVMRDGTEVFLTVTAVRGEALEGELAHGLLQPTRPVTLPLSEVATIERSGFSAGKTALAAVPVVGFALALAGFIFLLFIVTSIPA